nr:hypothetical protein [Parapedobacter defluvii]
MPNATVVQITLSASLAPSCRHIAPTAGAFQQSTQRKFLFGLRLLGPFVGLEHFLYQPILRFRNNRFMEAAYMPFREFLITRHLNQSGIDAIAQYPCDAVISGQCKPQLSNLFVYFIMWDTSQIIAEDFLNNKGSVFINDQNTLTTCITGIDIPKRCYANMPARFLRLPDPHLRPFAYREKLVIGH